MCAALRGSDVECRGGGGGGGGGGDESLMLICYFRYEKGPNK